jgi:hypothetical protein
MVSHKLAHSCFSSSLKKIVDDADFRASEWPVFLEEDVEDVSPEGLLISRPSCLGFVMDHGSAFPRVVQYLPVHSPEVLLRSQPPAEIFCLL